MNRWPALGLGSQRSARPGGVRSLRRSGLRAALAQVVLPVWFLWIGIVYPSFHAPTLAIDARLYQNATNAWLAGGDPWLVATSGTPYAAAPWSLLAYLPTAWLPVEVATWSWMVVGVAAALWTLRRLDMPIWWLAFPPLAQALWNGNAQPLVLAALLIQSPLGVTLAGGLKLYGFVPALVARRWRDLTIAAVILGSSLLVLPWGLWADHRFGLDAVAGFTWNGSAWRFVPLLPVAIVAVWALRRRGAEWFAIPVLWPGTQTFYHVFAMPALRDRPWLAAAFALPVPLLAPVAVIAYALLSRRDEVRTWALRAIWAAGSWAEHASFVVWPRRERRRVLEPKPTWWSSNGDYPPSRRTGRRGSDSPWG